MSQNESLLLNQPTPAEIVNSPTVVEVLERTHTDALAELIQEDSPFTRARCAIISIMGKKVHPEIYSHLVACKKRVHELEAANDKQFHKTGT